MSKRFLLSLVLVLIITNIATLLFWNQNSNEPEGIVLDEQGEKQIKANQPVATIGDKEILYKDWKGSLQVDYGEAHLKKLIDREVVKQLAEDKNIQVNEKVIDQGIALLTTMQSVMTEDEVEVAEEEWRKDLLHRYQLEALLAEDIEVSEEEIQDFYNGYHKQYDFSASLQLSHIIVENLETAEKVMKELDDGASFNLLAKEYSIDEETKDLGGYLGYFTSTSQFIPAGYYDKAVDMEEHSHSQPFDTGAGFAIIYLHRHLPSISFTYDEIKDQIRNELALKEYGKVLVADPLWEQLEIDWIYE